MITWKVIEGATYRMETSTDLESWDPLDDVMHKATSTEWIMAVTAPEGLRIPQEDDGNGDYAAVRGDAQ